MLWYFPLESYKSRYTFQLATWEKTALEVAGVPYTEIKSRSLSNEISIGSVLDAFNRSKFAMAQVYTMLDYIESGQVNSTDHLYFDDFWHPGIQAIPYAWNQKYPGQPLPKMSSFWYAQSVDEYDFTFKMLPWIRYWEIATVQQMDNIFVACPLMKTMIENQIPLAKERKNVHSVGLVFDSKQVTRMISSVQRENRVVFSSRLDPEKKPEFFLEVALQYCLEHDNDTTFVICSGRPENKVNGRLLSKIANVKRLLHERLEVHYDLSKTDYYTQLARAKVQFNCALQDFVSFTLLEASTAGCFPVYPRFRSFPETFQVTNNTPSEFLYAPFKAESAVDAIVNGLLDKNFTSKAIESRRWIHERFDSSFSRILGHLGLVENETMWELSQ